MDPNRARTKPIFVSFWIFVTVFQNYINIAVSAQIYDVDNLRTMCRLDCQELLLALPSPEGNFNTCDWNCKKHECKNGCDHWNSDADMSFTCLSYCSIKNYTCSSGCRYMEARKLSYIREIVKTAFVKKSQVTFNGIEISWELINPDIVGVTWKVELRNIEAKNTSWSFAYANLGSTGNLFTITIPSAQMIPLSLYEIHLIAFYKNRKVDVSESLYLKTNTSDQVPSLSGMIIQQNFIQPFNNFLICWNVPVQKNNIDYYNLQLNDDKNILVSNESTNSTCFTFSQLSPKTNYKISIVAVNRVGLSTAIVLPITVPETNLSEPVLYFANKSHIMKLHNIYDFHENPKSIYNISKSGEEITALHVLSDIVFVATTNQLIKIEPDFDTKPQFFTLPVPNVKIILADNLNQKIYLLIENKIYICNFPDWKCAALITVKFQIASAVIDIITGFVYYSTKEGVFRFVFGDGSIVEKLDFVPNQQCNLALDRPKSYLVCNYNDKVVNYNLITSKVDAVKSDLLRPGSQRRYDNVIRMVSWKENLIWISSPCKEPTSENSCLFKDDKDPANGYYSINNYLIQPGHGTLVDLGLGLDQLSPILLPPANLSALFSADTIRVVWNKPSPLRFQAYDFISTYTFQLELMSEEKTVKVVNVTNQFEYLFNHGSLQAKTKFTIRIRTCYRSICSRSIETSGRTFDASLPFKDTNILAVTSRFASTFTVLGANGSQDMSFDENNKPLFVARKSSTSGLILMSNGIIYSYDTVGELLVPTKSKLYNVTSFDFDPRGRQIYYSYFTGIYRIALDSDNREKIFPETGAKFITIMSTKALMIVGTSSNIYSLYFTGIYNIEYFACQTFDCEVLAVSKFCDKDKIYYIYRQNGILTLESSSFDGLVKKQISANLDSFPLNIKSLSCMFGKFVISTDDERLGIFDPDDGLINYYNLMEVEDFCILQTGEIVTESHLPVVVGMNFSNDANGNEILKWTIGASVKPSTASAFYKVQIFNSKVAESPLSETITDQTFVDTAGLNLTEINVVITAFNQWQTNTTVFNVRPPVSIPSKCKNPRIYSSKVKTPYNISSTVIFVWDPPFWYGFPKGYKVFCWSFADTIRSPYYTNGTEIDPNFPMHSIDNLPLDVTVYCQVSAGNIEKGYGMVTTPVQVSTSVDNSGSLLLISGYKSFGLYDTNKHDFVGKFFNSSSLYKSIGHIGNRVFVIEKSEESNASWVVKSGKTNWAVNNPKAKDQSSYRVLSTVINNFTQLTEVPLGLGNAQPRAMTIDWVGMNLYFVINEISDQSSSIWIYNLNEKNDASKIYDGVAGGTIEKLVFDPINSYLYFTQFTGVKLKLYQLDKNSMNTKPLNCDIVANSLAMKPSPADPTSNKVSVLAIGGGGLIDVNDCQVTIPALNFNVRMESILDMATDTKKIYLVTTSELVVYDISSSQNAQFDVSTADIETFCPTCQSYPSSTCLVFPFSSQNVSARPVGETSVEVVISDPIWPSECERVSRPSTVHIVTIKPTTEKDCNQNANCFEKETTNSSILFTALSSNREYEVTVVAYNAYNPRRSLSDPLKFNMSLGFESSPQQLQSFAATPDKILLVWMPPKSQMGSLDQVKYAISQIGNTYQSVGSLNFTVSCLKVPCQQKINGSLKPSTNYTFSIFAKTDKQSVDNAMQSRSNPASVKTLDLPGTLVEQQPNKSSNSLTFLWFKKENSLKSIKFSFQRVNEIKWRDFPQGFQQSNGGILYTIDHLEPDTQYSIKYIAEYNMKFNYNGNDLLFPSETFQMVTTSVTLTVNREPDAPLNLHIVTLNNEKYLNWTKPFDGGKDISMYKIEYKLDEKSNWTETEFGRYVSGNLQSAIKIPETFHTTPTTQFRIMAKNVNGWSPPAIVSLQSGQPVDGSKTKTNAVGIIVGVAIACLIILIIITVIFACRRRRNSKHPPLLGSSLPNAVYQVPARTEQDSLQTMKQISPDDIMALPHVPRSCITISKLLGSGAFGEVFEGLAYNLQLTGNQKTVRVAVKTLRPGSSENERVKFLKEAVLMKNLVHPNIVRLLGVCLESEPHWIVLELMEGGSLLQYLRSARPSAMMPSQVSLNDLINIALDVAKGCRYLEQIRHVHRDLASRNCLISSRDPQLRQVKIADFGLARDVDDDDYYRVQGHGLLPVRWMAPESLLDGLFTVKSDVWSFGVLLWEIMTLGKQPYAGKTNWEVINFVRLGGRLEKPDYCLDEIYQIMIFCWSFDSAARPSFVEVVDKLETLKQLDQFISDSPFPPFNINSRPSSQTTPENSQSKVQTNISANDGQVHVFATRSSARFNRKAPQTLSSRTKNKSKGFGFLSLRKNKERPPPPPLPTKEEILKSPRTSDRNGQQELRPGSGASSGASYTTSASGYEVPLLKNLKSNARVSDVGAENPAYEPFAQSEWDSTEHVKHLHGPQSSSREQKPIAPKRTSTSPNIPMTSITHVSSYENMHVKSLF